MTATALEERTVGSSDAPVVGALAVPRLGIPWPTLVTAATGVLMAGALLLARNTGLWLDEAQSVEIARRPLPDLFDALRHDGAPPLYYVLLHFWMRIVGQGDTAVRALSAVFAVAAVPTTMMAARAALGRRAVLGAGFVLATLPFLYRYGTEARMYSLVILLVAAAWALASSGRRVPLAIVSGLLLLTHYWAFFLVGAGVLLAAAWKRWSISVSLAAGGLLFLPWAPTFLFQSAHTGAPWARPARLDLFERAIGGFAAGAGRVSALGFLYFALAVLAFRHSESGRRLAIVTALPLFLGFLASVATSAAFADRYAAIVVVPFVLLVAAGLRHVGGQRATLAVLAGVVVLSGINTVQTVDRQRSQAPAVAAALEANAQPGDRVVFCPDQLGPAVMRLWDEPVDTRAYPVGDGRFVDWVDYADRNRSANVYSFAREMDMDTDGVLWVVAYPGYRTYGRDCTILVEELRRIRPGDQRLVKSTRDSFERASLWRFAPS